MIVALPAFRAVSSDLATASKIRVRVTPAATGAISIGMANGSSVTTTRVVTAVSGLLSIVSCLALCPFAFGTHRDSRKLGNVTGVGKHGGNRGKLFFYFG